MIQLAIIEHKKKIVILLAYKICYFNKNIIFHSTKLDLNLN